MNSTKLFSQYKQILNHAISVVPQLDSNADEVHRHIEVCDKIRSTIASLEELHKQGDCGIREFKPTS